MISMDVMGQRDVSSFNICVTSKLQMKSHLTVHVILDFGILPLELSLNFVIKPDYIQLCNAVYIYLMCITEFSVAKDLLNENDVSPYTYCLGSYIIQP